MSEPKADADLQQFVSATQWMRAAIPEFTATVRPLSELLVKSYALARKRTHPAVCRSRLHNVGWQGLRGKAFNECKRAPENQVNLAHVDQQKQLCVYIDTSDFI